MRKLFLLLSIFLALSGCREAQEPVDPIEAPVISNLMITPEIVCAGSGAQVTFLVSDPNGDRITWNAEMNTTQHGNIEQTSGTETSGTTVSIRFKAASGSSHRHRVTLKVDAADESGTKAETSELIFSVFSICS
jgi:hypothetical protein